MGKGPENKQRELKSVICFKWVKEMKGSDGEGITCAACAEALAMVLSAQGWTLWVCEFLSSARPSALTQNTRNSSGVDGSGELRRYLCSSRQRIFLDRITTELQQSSGFDLVTCVSLYTRDNEDYPHRLCRFGTEFHVLNMNYNL